MNLFIAWAVAALIMFSVGVLVGGYIARRHTLALVAAWFATWIVRQRKEGTYAGVIELPGWEAAARLFAVEFTKRP